MKLYDDDNINVNFPNKCVSEGEVEITLKEDNLKTFNTAFMGAINISVSLIKLEGYHGINLIFKDNKLDVIPRKAEDGIDLNFKREQKDQSWFKTVQKKLKVKSLKDLISKLKPKEKKPKPKKQEVDPEEKKRGNKALKRMVDKFLNKLP
ncbi:MAG: hypothetical protein ACOCP4_00475 [Candidatus Woesearchaeota archaeon]